MSLMRPGSDTPWTVEDGNKEAAESEMRGWQEEPVTAFGHESERYFTVHRDWPLPCHPIRFSTTVCTVLMIQRIMHQARGVIPCTVF